MNKKDFASGFLAESIGTDGTILRFVPGYGQTMPEVPFYLTATPPGQLTTLGNSEKLSVVEKLSDETFVIERAQGDTVAQDIRAGWAVSNAVYVGDVAPVTSVNGQTGDVVLDKTDIGLGNVPNIDTTAAVANEHTHANKAILDGTTAPFTLADQTKLGNIASNATANSSDAYLLNRTNHTGYQGIATVTGLQTALDGKQATITPGTTAQYYRGDKTFVALNKAAVGLGNVDNTADISKPISTDVQNALDVKEEYLAPGATTDYYRGDKTWRTLDKTAVGLSNVDNTSDANKPISIATGAAIDAHTGNTSNPHAVTKAQVGLGNVDNTSDLNKPVSTAQAAADALKVDKVNTASTLYGVNGSGVQASFSVSQAFADNSIAQRSTGGTLSVGTATSGTHATNKNYVDTADALKVSKTGDTMTGNLTVSSGVVSVGSTSTTGSVRAFDGVGNSNFVSIQTTGVKAGVFREGKGHFVYYDHGTGSTMLDSVHPGASVIVTSSSKKVNMNGVDYITGTGFPNGVISAPVGSIYIDTAATGEVVQWSKLSGTSNTGWAPAESEWRRVSTTRTTSAISAPVIYQGVFPSSYKFVRIVASGSVGGGSATDLYFNFETSAPTAMSVDFKKWYDSSGARVYLSATNSQNSSTLENLSTGVAFSFDSTWMFAGNGSWNSYNTLASAARGSSSVKDEYMGYTRTASRPTTFAIAQSASAIINTNLQIEVYVK